MVVVSLKGKGFIWLPEPFTPAQKITITRKDGTVDTINNPASGIDDVFFYEFDTPVTDRIGKFEMHLDNNNGTYSGRYSGGETVDIYLDKKDASTLKFEGYLENPKKAFSNEFGQYMILRGDHIASRLLNVTVTGSFQNATVQSILDSIYTTFAPAGFTYASGTYPATAIVPSIKWSDRPFWHCVVDLCNIGSYDAYVDNTKALRIFAQNTLATERDAVVFEDNAINVEGLGQDIVDVKNKVRVYGEDDEGVLVIYTASDAKSQTDYFAREDIIWDLDIRTYEQAKARGDAELALLKDPVIKGKTVVESLVYVNPGELIWVSLPDQQIHAQYKALNITHKFHNGDYTTELEISKITQSIAYIFKEQQVRTSEQQKIENPNRLSHSFNFSFDDATDLVSYGDFTITEGEIRLNPGLGSGVLLSATRVSVDSISQVEARAVGADISSSSLEVSADGGLTWTSVTLNALTTLSVSGKQLKWQFTGVRNLDNPNPLLKSLVVYY